MGMFEWKRADLEDGDRFENCLKYVLQLTLSSLRINEEKQTLIIFLLIGQRAGLVLNTSKIVMLATVTLASQVPTSSFAHVEDKYMTKLPGQTKFHAWFGCMLCPHLGQDSDVECNTGMSFDFAN